MTAITDKRILIAEDDAEIALLESDYLEMNGFEVEVVDDGADVIPRLLGKEYSLLLLDVMLPGKSGYDICREVRDRIDIPILMVTARSESTDKIRGLGLGADDYIAKPFDPGELVARVRSHLKRFDRLVGERAEAAGSAVGAASGFIAGSAVGAASGFIAGPAVAPGAASSAGSAVGAASASAAGSEIASAAAFTGTAYRAALTSPGSGSGYPMGHAPGASVGSPTVPSSGAAHIPGGSKPGAAFPTKASQSGAAHAPGVARLGSAQDADCITVGDLRIMPASWSVRRNDEPIKLTHREFELLKFMAENPNIVFSKDTLFERIWGYDYVGDSATVTVHINRIREKIEEMPSSPKIIETIWGVGYRLNM